MTNSVIMFQYASQNSEGRNYTSKLITSVSFVKQLVCYKLCIMYIHTIRFDCSVIMFQYASQDSVSTFLGFGKIDENLSLDNI